MNYRKIVALICLGFAVFISVFPQQINLFGGNQKLNNLVIFDLFLNFELAQKNDNLSTLVDYFPERNKAFKSISVNSNMGGRDENLYFQFNEKGTFDMVTYEVKNMIYTYDFVYDGNQLTSINIGGKRKISFTYIQGRLRTMIRVLNGAELEYTVEYMAGLSRANIKLVVIKDGKRSKSSEENFITWNKDYKIGSYRFDVYSGKKFTYSATGELLSFTFSNVSRDDNQADWTYTRDEKGNWTERKSKEMFCKRTIEYR